MSNIMIGVIAKPWDCWGLLNFFGNGSVGYVIAIAASVVTGLPIKWIEDRRENLQADSFARDLKILEEGGFSLRKIQPVDMFPQTRHIELIAFLSYTSESV